MLVFKLNQVSEMGCSHVQFDDDNVQINLQEYHKINAPLSSTYLSVHPRYIIKMLILPNSKDCLSSYLADFDRQMILIFFS